MKWLLGTYTSRFNRRHKEFGHLFSGRYKALIVDGSGSGYLKTACDYVHLNPERAKLVKAAQPLRAFPWSSYPAYLSAPARRPAWLRVDRLLGEWRIPADTAAGRREFEQGMEGRRRDNRKEEFKPLERGWCLGSEQFRQELLDQVSAAAGPSHYGEAKHEAVQARAERLVAEGLRQLKWGERDLRARRKSAPGKLKLAHELRSKTTMPLAWIADRLHMGSRGYLAWLLGRRRKVSPPSSLQPLLKI